MSITLLEYSSWLFQLIVVLAILYLVAGLVQPSVVWARKRSTVAITSIIVLLLSATAFYLTVIKLPGGRDTPAEIGSAPSTPPK